MAHSASVISVHVGKARHITGARPFKTAIHKTSVSGLVAVSKTNLRGDEQADLSVHGGPDKAVYIYPSEHYAYWREQLAPQDLEWGNFGENLTTQGLLETKVAIGDRLRIGTALLEVRQPRTPCYKLAHRLGRSDMVKRFWAGRRPGFYLGVLEEGSLQAGDRIHTTQAGAPRITVAQVFSLLRDDTVDLSLVRTALENATLPEPWKISLRQRFSEVNVH